jgi:hypothetical protein
MRRKASSPSYWFGAEARHALLPSRDTKAALFGMAARLAANVAVRRLDRSSGPARLDEIARLVEADATDRQAAPPLCVELSRQALRLP